MRRAPDYFVQRGTVALLFKVKPHSSHPLQIVRDKAGRVLNNAGAAVAVVHQYDRSNQLKEQYDREYVWLPDQVLRLK